MIDFLSDLLALSPLTPETVRSTEDLELHTCMLIEAAIIHLYIDQAGMHKVESLATGTKRLCEYGVDPLSILESIPYCSPQSHCSLGSLKVC